MNLDQGRCDIEELSYIWQVTSDPVAVLDPCYCGAGGPAVWGWLFCERGRTRDKRDKYSVQTFKMFSSVYKVMVH